MSFLCPETQRRGLAARRAWEMEMYPLPGIGFAPEFAGHGRAETTKMKEPSDGTAENHIVQGEASFPSCVRRGQSAAPAAQEQHPQIRAGRVKGRTRRSGRSRLQR